MWDCGVMPPLAGREGRSGGLMGGRSDGGVCVSLYADKDRGTGNGGENINQAPLADPKRNYE